MVCDLVTGMPLAHDSRDLASVRNALRAAQKRLARVSAKKRSWGLTPRQLRLALRIYVLTGLDPNPVSRFADMVRRRRGSHGMLTGVVGDGVVPIADIYGRWLPADVGGLLAPTTPAGVRELQEAQAFVAKLRTCAWIAKQNFAHGVAPDMRSVLEKYNQERLTSGLPQSLALNKALHATFRGKPCLGRYGRRWAQRYRKRFCISRKRLPAKQHLTAETLLPRVPGQDSADSRCSFHISVVALRPFFLAPKVTLLSGSCFRRGLETCHCPTPFLGAAEALFFFEWCDWCQQQAMANGTPPLWLNFDEACVPKGEGGAVGAVVGRLWWPTAEEPLDAFAGKYKKTCLSLLLTVAAEAAVQATLPQIFLGNHATFPVGIASMQGPGSSEFWRQRSAWNSGSTMIRYLDRLAASLEGYGGRQVILVYDCASMHVTEAVLRHAAAKRIWIVLVPPGCTFALQPADTSVFSCVKRHLRQKVEVLKQEAPQGAVSHMAWLGTLLSLPAFLQSRPWLGAFQHCGIVGDRARLAPSLLSLAGHRAANAGVVGMPTPEAMAAVYPAPVAERHWLFMQQTIPLLD